MGDETTRTMTPEIFYYLLDMEVKKAIRYLYFFSLAIVQSDRPLEGNKKAEKLLQNLASLIHEEIRETDIIGKIGSDQFYILFHQTDAHGVQRVGNRIRERIEQYSFQVNGDKVQLTASIGAASFPSHANELDALIRRTREALNHAKEIGGNQVLFP